MRKKASVSKKETIGQMPVDDQTALFKRYLLWLYKTTKDECDRIERKFTQLEIDRDIEKILEKKVRLCAPALKQNMASLLGEWKAYRVAKEADAQRLKFGGNGQLDAGYVFNGLKLRAIQEIILARLGRKGLLEIKHLYEDAAVKRILEDVSGRR